MPLSLEHKDQLPAGAFSRNSFLGTIRKNTVRGRRPGVRDGAAKLCPLFI